MQINGVIYVIKGSAGKVKGYIYKSIASNRYTYIPLHKIGKYKGILKLLDYSFTKWSLSRNNPKSA